MSERPQGVRERPDPVYEVPGDRLALLDLIDACFPGLPAGIDRARELGFDWARVTWPFVARVDGEIIAHTGVLLHRVLLDGEVQEVAGIHAVATHPAFRRRGLARQTLQEAMAWVDERFQTAKLGTDVPPVYAPHGFEPVVPHTFAVDHEGGEARGRPATPDELWSRCDGRDPVSHRFASLDPGWLVGIDLAIQRRTPADLHLLEPLDAVVDWNVDANGVLHLHDVFAPTLPPLADLLALAPAHAGVRIAFCPDRLAPDARPVPQNDGVWMVRGRWPLSGPIGMGRLMEH